MRFISHSILRWPGVVAAGLYVLSVAYANDGVSRAAKLPLSFEPNVGQAAPSVKFLARGPGYTLLLTDDGATLVMQERAAANRKRDEGRGRLRRSSREPQARVVRLKFLGANSSPKVMGTQRLPGTSNYFAGNLTRNWHTNVPTYARVIYTDVYRGVDLVYYGNQQGELEYDFVVKPGSDPNVIALGVVEEDYALPQKRNAGARKALLQVTSDGGLAIRSGGGGRVRFHRPTVYQDTRLIDGHYVLRPSRRGREIENEAGFAVSAYDHTKPLVIDPVLSYSTYLGGTDLDYAYGIAVDNSGSAYVTGYTASVDFPLDGSVQSSPGNSGCATGEATTCFDAFVTKLNPSGTAIVYSTYLGGSSQDYGMKIAVDSSGHAYVTGYTNSTDFPVLNAIQASNGGGYDAFIAELSADGASLVYSTYWGGSGDDLGYGIAVDSEGNAYVAGSTTSSDFPVTSGAFQTGANGGEDGFVVKIEPGGMAAGYATFLGGTSDDYAYGVAVDSSGDAYVSGATNSSDFPALNAFQSQYAGGVCGASPSTFACFDAFVAKLNPAGSGLVYSTFLGGTGGDYGYAIALDASANAYVTGYTTSMNFPVTTGAFQRAFGGTYDAFVAKLDGTGSSLAYATYLGGSGTEVACDIGVDSAGRAYIAGYNYGGNYPTANPLEAKNAGLYDVIASVLDASGSSLIFSTYLGGSYDEMGRGIAVDASGNGYITGATFSVDFPVTPGSYQTTYGGDPYDAFVAKFNPEPSPSVTLSLSSYDFGDQIVETASSSETITLSNTGTAALAISSISAGGDFAVSQSCPNPLPVGFSCALSVTFTPSVTGNQTGAVTITDNAPNSPQKISLTGNGVAAYVLSADTSSVSIMPGTDSLTFTLTAASQYGYTGNITLACSGNSPAACLFTPAVIAPGASATLTVSGLSSLGTDALSFSVVGSSGVQSASTSMAILVEDFSIAASPAKATVTAGNSASYTITVTPVNGFDLAVNFACSGAPANSTCSVASASSAAGNSVSTAAVTLKVQTTASSRTTPRSPLPPEEKKRLLRFGVVAWLIILLAAGAKAATRSLCLPHPAVSPFRRAAGCGEEQMFCSPAFLSSWRLAFVLPLLAGCLACGGGGGGGSQTSGSSVTGTPAGTYTLTVTATATPSSGSSFSRTTTVTMTVD